MSLKRTKRNLDRLAFYISGSLSRCVPRTWWRRQRPTLLTEASRLLADDRDFLERRDHCCRIQQPFELGQAGTIASLDSQGLTTYYYDLQKLVRYFPPQLQLRYLFGDLTVTPDQPTLVKSRPIGSAADNANAVLLRLNQVRHYRFAVDKRPYRNKRDAAVWRGKSRNKPVRQEFLKRYRDHPTCDIGDSDRRMHGTSLYRPYLSIGEQLAYKCVISIEGNDVATNLKWIMASNSVCLMAQPRFETWFLESRLKPDHHYIQLRDDFADLDEQLDRVLSNPDLAEWIIANAQSYVVPFRDRHRERLLGLAVLDRYFHLSGQTGF